MAKTKKQHYVPQSYLRRFTQDGKRLYVYDKVLHKSLGLVSVKDIAQESYFYDIPTEALTRDIPGANKDPQLAERALAELENKFNEVIDVGLRVAKGGGATLEERVTMSLCVTVQLMRTRFFRDGLTTSMEKLTEVVLNAALELANPDLASQLRVEVQKYKKEAAAALHASFMWDSKLVNRIAETFYNHIWLLGINQTNTPFYTSDNPVVIQAHKDLPEYMPCPDTGPAFSKAVDIVIESSLPGLESEGVEIAFPLSPKYILIMLERTYFKDWEPVQGRRVPLGMEDIQAYNQLQILQSDRQVFCNQDNFGLVEQICKEHPEACSLDRRKFEIRQWKWDTNN